jgi:hypothetical protein
MTLSTQDQQPARNATASPTRKPSRKMMTPASNAQREFRNDFIVSWKRTVATLALVGIRIGAEVRNKDGALFRLAIIEPRVHNFGNPGASISLYGFKLRANGTWGTFQHWCGDLDDLTVE